MAKISIIVPVYNVEKYLLQCIDSICSQTFSDFELILVDDGSLDRSGEICDKYALQDNRVKVIHKPNGGVSSARNTGLDNAQGEYVMFCDSDDYAEPQWCEELLNMIQKHPESWCFCGCHCVDANDKIFKSNCVYNKECNYQILSMSEYWNIYKTNYSALLWIRIFNNEIIKKYNIRFDENMSVSEDVLFNLEYGKHCNEFAIVNLPLYNHRSYLNNEADHLDGKLPEERFYMNRRIYNARSPFVPKEYRLQFETEFFYSFITDMKSIAKNYALDKRSKQTKISEILKSFEFCYSMKKADLSKESWKLLLFFKLKFTKVVLYLFEKG